MATGLIVGILFDILYLYMRAGGMAMHSRTDYFPTIGDALRFKLGYDADKITQMAESFMTQHAKATGMMWPGLESMTQLSTCIVKDGWFCGTNDIYIAGTYVVVFKQEKFLGLCFSTESYEVFPLSQLTFAQYASRGRNIAYFVPGAAFGVVMGVAASNLNFGYALGVVIGGVAWWFSGLQNMTFGVRDGLHVGVRVPYALSNPGQLCLDILKPLFPPELQHEITNDEEPQAKYEGKLGPLGGSAGAASGCCSKLTTICALGCSAASATMAVHTHHVVTNNSDIVRCCRCLSILEQCLYAIIKNLFALGDTTFISILRNVPVIRCQMPGIRGAALTVIAGVFLAIVVGGIINASGGSTSTTLIVLLIIIGVFVLWGLVKYFGRRSTVYIGEEEWRGTYITTLGRNFHHIEFAAAGHDADEIVGELTRLQALSRERSFNVGGAAPKTA